VRFSEYTRLIEMSSHNMVGLERESGGSWNIIDLGEYYRNILGIGKVPHLT
jgi:hypothetical protein